MNRSRDESSSSSVSVASSNGGKAKRSKNNFNSKVRNCFFGESVLVSNSLAGCFSTPCTCY